VTIQATLDSNRTHRAVGRRLVPQHPIIPLAVDLDLGDIAVEARALSSQSFTLGHHEEAVQLLLDLVKVFKWPMQPWG
jgi:hypothetical protein